MPVQFPYLAWHLAHSDTTQQTANILNAQIRGANQIAQIQTTDQAQLETTSQIQESRHTAASREIREQARGARSFARRRRERKREPPQQFRLPEDPHGRGQFIDVQT
jgi:hypothetical protein